MIPYIINVALILAGCLLFYKLLLQKETFYRTNRWVLLLCLVVSFGLPLLPVPEQWSFRKAGDSSIQNTATPTPLEMEKLDAVSSQTEIKTNKTSTTQTVSSSTSAFNFQNAMVWLLRLYWFGVIAFGINFLVQVIALLYRAYTRPVIKDGFYRIVEVSGDKAPCSFANNIFINPGKYEWDVYNQILLHEKVHIRQKHTLDILLAESILVFQWFNPFAWLYRKEIEKNLEFLTDNELIQHKEVESASYQLSLLKVSTPHFPLSLTTNYNQSLLKKRIAMMNAKKSNMHTAWKYFFLLPLLVLFASLLNKPVAFGQNEEKIKEDHGIPAMDTEGSWFATIKKDRIQFQFKSDEDDDNSMSGNSFPLSDFPNLPRGTSGAFKLTRDPGTMEFTGKFDGDQGMGRYKFTGDKSFDSFISGELKEEVDENDLMTFFLVNVSRSYVQMLKSEGFASIDKGDLIPAAALNIDQPFLRSIRNSGYTNLDLGELIPIKALDITESYIREIKNAGYPDISLSQLISFKAQGIDGKYISKVREARSTDKTKGSEDEAGHMISFKALNITDEWINSFKSVGYSNIETEHLIPMKSLGITPEYIKSFQDMGYKDVEINEYIPVKSLGITPEFLRSFESVGFKNLTLEESIPVKATGVTAEYIKEMKEKGFNYSSIGRYVTLKSVSGN